MTKYTVDRLNDCLVFAGFSTIEPAWAPHQSFAGGTNLASEITRLETHYGLTHENEPIGKRLASIEAFQAGVAER